MLFSGLLFLLFSIFVRPQDFWRPFQSAPFFEITSIILTIATILSSLKKKAKPILKSPQDILMILLWVAIVLSAISVRWLQFTFDTFIDWLRYILVYFLIINIVDSRKRFKIILWAIVIFMSLTAGMGVLQHFGTDITRVGTHPDGRIRGVGIFDTNQLAYSVAFCASLAIGLLLFYKKLIIRIVTLGILLLYFYCIYFTQSRGGLVCLVLVLLFTFLIFSKSKFIKTFGIIISLLFVFLLSTFAPRFSTTKEYKTDSSVMGRVEVWADALSLMKGRPFFGVGKDQFYEYFKLAPHSSYIQSLTELGVIGLFLWMALFYFSLKNLQKLKETQDNKKDRYLLIFSNALQVSMYSYLAGSFFSGNTYYITLYVFFALIVVLQNISGFSEFAKLNRITLKELIKIAGIVAAIIVLLHLFIKTASH